MAEWTSTANNQMTFATAFFCLAQRFLCAAAIFSRASGDMVRFPFLAGAADESLLVYFRLMDEPPKTLASSAWSASSFSAILRARLSWETEYMMVLLG
jgi:hypothetical protein